MTATSPPISGNMRDSQKAFAHMVDRLRWRKSTSGIKLLWGTANLFSNPRHMAGAATNPDPEVYACAALQVRDALEATKKLGGSVYVLWGGREGYETPLNTDLQARNGADGPLPADGRRAQVQDRFRRPDPDRNGSRWSRPSTSTTLTSRTVYGFLKQYGLEKEVQVNIECNHATLAATASSTKSPSTALGCFGSVDANRGDSQNGWDTDQFPNDVNEVAMSLYHVLKPAASPGRLQLRRQVRRQSVDALDLMYAHVGGVDTLAHGLLIAANDRRRQTRPVQGCALRRLGSRAWASRSSTRNSTSPPSPIWLPRRTSSRRRSGRQEMLETIVSRYA